MAVWDGNETTEYTIMHKPKLNVATTGGTGPNLTGRYSFCAVISWRDGSGLQRRSAPTRPVTTTLAGTKPIVYVTLPNCMRDGFRQEEFDIVIYMTGDLSSGGTSLFYAQNTEPTNKNTNGCWTFGNVPTPLVADIQLYSSGAIGEQLLPECPPPAWDLDIGNSRLWVLDAEDRNRLLPSMLRQSFVPFEFNGSLEVRIPSSYGRGMAVRNNNGTITVFAERGIWAIPGYGPNNAGQDGAFGEPVLLSNIGCRSRESVVNIPGVGLLFQCSDGVFAILSGQGIKRFDTIGSYYDVGTPGVNYEENEIVYPLKNGILSLVFNWVSGQWTKWPTADGFRIPTSSATIYETEDGTTTGLVSRVLQYVPATGAIEYSDSDTASETDGIEVTRGWVVPESPQADCAIRECWYHARYAGPHSITIRVAYDYSNFKYVEKTWSDSELTPLLEDGRYTVAVNVHHVRARAVKITITESYATEGEGTQPLTLTVTYGVAPGVRRRTLRAGALK